MCEIKRMADRVSRQMAAAGLHVEVMADVSYAVGRIAALAEQAGRQAGLKIAIDRLSAQFGECGGIDGQAELIALYEHYYDAGAGVSMGDTIDLAKGKATQEVPCQQGFTGLFGQNRGAICRSESDYCSLVDEFGEVWDCG
ncbi:MAG: hypothetical protein P1P81_08155 [Desulfobulbales bacterium]|nr:hypothetical protein [Desulfobulbales bacterium]